MPELSQRRSPRIASQMPIRVFGQNIEGNNFYEDSSALVISREGARILLSQKPDPGRQLFILCHKTDLGGRFRLVGPRGRFEQSHESWAVENVTRSDIWGVPFPTVQAKDQKNVRVKLACTDCHSRKQLFLNESLVEWLYQQGTVRHECPVCKGARLSVLVPYAKNA